MSELEASLMGLCTARLPLSEPSCDTTKVQPGRRCPLGTPYSSPVTSPRSLFRPSCEDYEHDIYGMRFEQEFGAWALQSQCLSPSLSIMCDAG